MPLLQEYSSAIMTCRCTSSGTSDANLPTTSLTDVCTSSSFLVFMSLVNAWIRTNDKISGASQRVKPVETPNYEYDFVVVGGGGAGAVVASRLSENPSWNVLLLEAGEDEPAGAEIPAFAFGFLRTKNMWNYTTTNEDSACLSTGGSCAWSSGKNLGGNTAHNAMIYLRGHPKDFDNWAALGNEGWTWEEVEPFFIKGENNGEIDRVGRKHHGTGGPLSVERFPWAPELSYAILNASKELGYGVSEDLNGENRTGFAIVQATNNKGVRCSSATAYLRPVRDRKNLHVSLNSLVTKVIIEDGAAVGVEYYKNGEKKSVYASREVVLSAGVIGSPHILLLSGIGPQDHLESFDIELVEDLPGVGQNLHDHATALIDFTVNQTDTYDNDWEVAVQYITSQTGPMSALGSVQSLGLLETKYSTTPGYPDIEIYFKGYVASCASGEVGGLQSTGRRTVTTLPSLLHPVSKGTLELASNDPFDLPKIHANYLNHADDLAVMVDGMRIILKLIATEALSAYDFQLTEQPVEACSSHEFNSDEYWGCVMKQNNLATYHQVGTCKMGPANDPLAVVDPRLRVYGIKGLRVADNSIMPQVTSSNTQAPAMMIGERAAHFIKEDWDRKFSQGICAQI